MEQPEIRDNHVAEHEIKRHAAQRADGTRPPVDADELDDYREFQAWKRRQEEAQALAADLESEPKLPTQLVIEVEGEDRVYKLCDLNRDVIAHLQVLVTFAESDGERAIALFEAMMLPDEFDRLKKDLRKVMRDVRKRHAEDASAPTIEQTWRSMAEAVARPIRELMTDPKRAASLVGQSPTGDSSSIDSAPRSALPSMN